MDGSVLLSKHGSIQVSVKGQNVTLFVDDVIFKYFGF